MKIKLIFLLIIISTGSFCQIEPKVTQGHSFKLGALNFSENSQFAVSYAGDNKLLLWDANFRKEIVELKGYQPSAFGAALSSVDLTHSGSHALLANGMGLFIWSLNSNFKNKPIQQQTKFKGCSSAMFIDEERICCISDKKVKIYNFKTDSIEHESEELTGYFFLKHANSHTKKIVLTSESEIKIFSTETLDLLYAFESPVKEPITVSIHPSEDKMLIAGNSHTAIECDFNGQKTGNYEHEEAMYLPICHYDENGDVFGISHNKLFKWKNGVGSFVELPFEAILSSPSVKKDKLLIGNWDFTLGSLDLNTESYHSFEVTMAHCEGLESHENGFTYKGRDGIVRSFYWNAILEPEIFLSSRNEEYTNVQTLGNLKTFHQTNEFLISANQSDIILLNKKNTSIIKQWKSDNNITSICGNNDLGFDVSQGFDGSEIFKTDFINASRKLFIKVPDETVTHMVYSSEAGLIAFCDGSFSNPSKILFISKNGAIKKTIEVSKSAFTSVELNSENDKVIFSSGGSFPETKVLDLKSKEIVAKFDGRISSYSEEVNAVAIHNKSWDAKTYEIDVFNLNGKRLSYLADAHQGVISHMKFSANGKYLISASWDKSLKIWDWKNKEVILTIFFSNGTDDIYLFSKENYYYTSKNTVEDVYFEYKGAITPYQQYDLQLNRPDKILSLFEESDSSLIQFFKEVREKRIERLGLAPLDANNFLNIPETEKVMVIHKPENQTITFIKPHQNDIIKLNGVELNRASDLTKKLGPNGVEYSLNMVSGMNQIEIYRQNSSGLRGKSQYHQFQNNVMKESNLYLITLAASKFKEENFNLTYASKDAKDIQNYFSENWKSGEVNSLELIDEEFTLGKIDRVSSFLSSAKTNDVVMVFISSHGVFDAEFNYFIATHDMNFNQPSESGMTLNSLEAQMIGCNANKKVVFIDACHSGEIDKSEISKSTEVIEDEGDVSFRSFQGYQQITSRSSFLASKEIFTDLSSTNGVTYISSAAGVEFALEGDEWKNGVFTYSLLEGLKTSKADSNNDNKITLTELENYLFEKVPALTGGKQQPNSRIKNPYLDFTIQEKK